MFVSGLDYALKATSRRFFSCFGERAVQHLQQRPVKLKSPSTIDLFSSSDTQMRL